MRLLLSLLILLSSSFILHSQDSPIPSAPLIEQPAPQQPDLTELIDQENTPQDSPLLGRGVGGEASYGYLSYNDVLQAHPDYPAAQAQINALRQACQDEIKHNQEAFSKAYYEYIEGQQTFDPYILLKRQKELEQQLNNNEAFKTQALALLAEKENALLAPIHQQLTDIINRIGLERNYLFIVNTDNQAYLFLNGAIGTDITADVLLRMKNEE